MPGQNSPGYQAAYHRATRLAATLFRNEHPERWRIILDNELNQRATPTEEEAR